MFSSLHCPTRIFRFYVISRGSNNFLHFSEVLFNQEYHPEQTMSGKDLFRAPPPPPPGKKSQKQNTAVDEKVNSFKNGEYRCEVNYFSYSRLLRTSLSKTLRRLRSMET